MALGVAVLAHGAERTAEKPEHARLHVTGLGWLDNLRMKGVLRQLRPASEAPRIYDMDAVEDDVFLLFNHVERLGYLRATITTKLTLESGEQASYEWKSAQDMPLPRPLGAREVDYDIHPGIRYYYEDLEFQGLQSVDVEEARRYFVRTDGLLRTRALLRFSRGELDDAIENLQRALQSEGHAEATVRASKPDINDTNGAVRVVIEVHEGPVHQAKRLSIAVRDVAEGPVLSQAHSNLNLIVSRAALQDLEQDLVVDWYHLGYPDANASVTAASPGPGTTNEVIVDLRAEVIRGPRVRLGEVRFEGPISPSTREALQRRVSLSGPWLDRLAVDGARAHLARLGGYRFINIRYEPSPTDPNARNAVFEMEPGKRLSIDILAGLRSYELLYGGVDLIRRNLFGVGHSAELRFVQSFKSSEGYASYSIPDAFAKDVTAYALLDALRREEISFRREELRTSLGMRWAPEGSSQQLGLRYNYELLRAVDAPVDERIPLDGADQPKVASFTVDWSLDRRDSAIQPHQGYNLGASVEFAFPEFGGEARYLRPELDASWHLPLGGGRYLHAGLRYSLVADPSDEGLVPFNKRVFPGGEDTVRGFQRGEAAPRNARGELIGAESAFIWNLEFEQLLTPSWSVVTFVDGVAETSDIHRLPWDEVLWSVGLGLRWNTAIGPVRLEYGHNLNPRAHDPAGTVQFSVGFPF